MKRLLQVVMLLALLQTGVFAQWQGGAAGGAMVLTGIGLFLHGSVTEEECHSGQLWDVTYWTVLGLGKVNVVTQVEGPNGPCACMVSGGSLRSPVTTASSAPKPKETNCSSDNGTGAQVTVPGQEAAGSTGGFGGPSSVASGNGPSPEGFGPGRPLEATAFDKTVPQLSAHAAGGSAFTYTLPFRNLPWGPLINEAGATPPWACNATVNPTMFRVFHVSNTVTRYNMCSGQVVATINVPDLPLQVRVTPDGSKAIVTSFSGAITFINTGTNTVTGSIQNSSDPNFAASGIAISPDGSYALVTNYPSTTNVAYSYLSVVDVARMQITGKIPLTVEGAESVFINPDGTLAWVTHPWDNAVEVVDILTGTIVRSLGVFEPFSIVFNPTGTRAFVSSGIGSVGVIDTATYQTIQTVPADQGAMDLQITPDGAYIFVNNSMDQSITVINTQSLSATTIKIGAMPQGSVIVPWQ